jgi:tetratricopeptide (TPR) repeat protein
MEPEARRILRAAAVFGEVFLPAGVAHLLGDHVDVTPWLAALSEREVIARRAGDPAYVFRHALVRDAAYAMLTPDDRALGHRLAAAWLEEGGDRDPVRLAEHHERGAAPARALAYWLRAAELALGACDLPAVLAHVKRAVACGAAGGNLGQLRLLAAEAHEWRGEFPEAARAAREALRWLSAGDPLWFGAAGILATAAGVQGHGRELLQIADELERALAATSIGRAGAGPVGEAVSGGVEGAEPTGAPAARPWIDDADAPALASARLAEQLIITGHLDRADRVLAQIAAESRCGPAAGGRVQAVLALRARYGGDVAGNLTAVHAAVERFGAAGDRRNLCVHRERLGYARMEIGDYAGAEKLLKDALATARQLGLRNVAATARHNLGLALSRLGRPAEGLEVEREALAEFVTSGNRRMRGAALEYLALIHLDAGDPVAAETAARDAVTVASVAPALPLNQAESWAILGRALLAQGRGFDALEVAEHGVAMLERLGGIDDGEAIILLTHAEALTAVGDDAAAAEALRRARGRLLERATRIRDDRLRVSFLDNVPENRRTLELAKAVSGA